MSLLEAQVKDVRELLSSVTARDIDFSSATPSPKGLIAGLILKDETYAELGTPEGLSAQVLLYSNDATDTADCVRVIGPDLEDLKGQSVNFAEVVILKGKNLDAEAFYQFNLRHLRLIDHPGFMVKATGGKIWVRSAIVGEALPSFAEAGATLIARTHQSLPQVEGVEVWFITGDNFLINTLSQLAQQLLPAAESMKENVWKARGFDYKNCRISGHCGSCSDKKTCASIRGMEQKVKLHRREEAKAAAEMAAQQETDQNEI